CTNPGLILGLKGQKLDDFTQLLGESIKKIEPTVMLHPNIKKQYDSAKGEMLQQKGYTSIAALDVEVKENYGSQQIIKVSGEEFLKNKNFHKEVFGPFSVVVACKDKEELGRIIKNLEGQLTGTVLNTDEKELHEFSEILDALTASVGRVIYNSVPTGVEVCAAMTHGGPYPATSNAKFTSVGLTAVQRWVRPVSFQDWPDALLPDALKNNNPLQIMRTVNGDMTKDSI
ncbi:MAG: aldehyde dehydrogenase family protein, partial [Leeuwenhoekiella sp.]